MKKKFEIEGMTCSACQLSIEKKVKELGYENVNVSLMTNSMYIEEDNINIGEIINSIENLGYKAIIKDNNQNNNIKKENIKMKYENQANHEKMNLFITIPLVLIMMYISMGEMIGVKLPKILRGVEGAGIFSILQFIISAIVVYVNRQYFIRGFKSLFKKSPNMDTLVSIGATASILYGIFATLMISYGLGINDDKLVLHYRHDIYFESATMILMFISLGNYLELRAKSKTTEAIDKLIDMQPEYVNIIKNGYEIQTKVEEVNINDLIKIKPGERIALDGIVIEGKSTLDMSSVTGESMPVEINEGDNVVSGSLNNTGAFLMKVTNVGDDTTISKIINLMEVASATKAPIAKLADKISGIFVPVVIILSIITFIFWMVVGKEFTFALSTAIGVLVISCPCALGLATPVAMMVAAGKSAENGIVVKNSEALEILHKIDTIIFDKTGTVTYGKPMVTDIISISDMSYEQMISIAKVLEQDSEHPLANAIKNLNQEDSNIEKTNFESYTGKGVMAIIDSKKYFIGNKKFVNEKIYINQNIFEHAKNYEKNGKTVVYLFDEKNILGFFAIADQVKNTAESTIKYLKNKNIKTVMLTGDNNLTAKFIGEKIGIDEIHSELLPQDKDDYVIKYKKEGLVAMVGDGINDAPALMRADIGISFADGTDIAEESSDLVLMKSDLTDIVNAIEISKLTLTNIKQNLFLAFIYNIVLIPVAMGVLYPGFGIKLNPMFAAFAMGISSIFVVLNSLRLKNIKLTKVSKNDVSVLSNEVNYDTIVYVNNIRGVGMERRVFKIEGMSCLHCKAAVERELKKISNDVIVSLSDGEAVVKVEKDLDDNIIINAIEKAGYKVVL